MEKQLNSFLGLHSKIPLVYIPFNWASNQFVFCNIMQNSVTSIIVDSYETDKTHRHHSKPPLIMNIQIWKERAQLFCDNSWLRPSKRFNWKYPLDMAEQTDAKKEDKKGRRKDIMPKVTSTGEISFAFKLLPILITTDLCTWSAFYVVFHFAFMKTQYWAIDALNYF